MVNEYATDLDVHSVTEESKTFISETKSESKVLILRAKDPVKAIAEATAAYDLLIIGTPIKSGMFDLLLGNAKDKFADNATCSVLRLSIK